MVLRMTDHLVRLMVELSLEISNYWDFDTKFYSKNCIQEMKQVHKRHF
jgi:hypothetical protein